MAPLRQAKLGSLSGLLALGVLALLPLAPELYLCVRNHDGLKSFAPIGYYEMIVSFLLLAPALVPNRLWARGWVVVVGSILGMATLITAFQAASAGARWDVTAHSAMMQTSPGEAWSFVRTFASWDRIGWILLLITAFAGAIIIHYRAPMPARRRAGVVLLLGFLPSGYGLLNVIRYNGPLTHSVVVANGETLAIAEVAINKYHPVTMLLLTHYNYRVTHNYYLSAYQKIAANLSVFQGATSVPGAESPRVVVVVVGESASRRHWSLYGYTRETNPGLRSLGDSVLLFSDVISSSVGTQNMLRAMFTTNISALPVFPLFAGAGYQTHWFSAQYNQGATDVEIAALIQSNTERVFLNGAYDGNLLPLVQRTLVAPGKHIIFLNLFGSHVRYDDRYPAAFDVFKGLGEKDHRIAAYDNSIRYTDYVLTELIKLLQARTESSCLLYVSDHAEDVYDSNPATYLFRSDALATNPMYEVPFMVWFSPEYRKGNSEFVRAVAQARDRKFQTTALYHSLIDLTRLTHPLFDPHRSVFSSDFMEAPRRVGAMNRLYTK